MVPRQASDRRDIYTKDEITKFKEIKRLHPKASWENVTILFNKEALEGRQRTKEALIGKWKQMENNKKDTKILCELKHEYHQSSWQEILEHFNKRVPPFRRKSTVKGIKLIWEGRDEEKDIPLDQNALFGTIYNPDWDTFPNNGVISGETNPCDPTLICDTYAVSNYEQFAVMPEYQTNFQNSLLDTDDQMLFGNDQ
ncbi:hypothetical protein FQN57_003992, partial [Myotisia sp. PD_48]